MTTSSLTQEIIDHGVVMVYMRFVGFGPEINQWPTSRFYERIYLRGSCVEPGGDEF